MTVAIFPNHKIEELQHSGQGSRTDPKNSIGKMAVVNVDISTQSGGET